MNPPLPTRAAPSELLPRLHKSTLHIANGILTELSLRFVVPRAIAGPANTVDLREALSASFAYASAELGTHYVLTPQRSLPTQHFFEQTDRFSGKVHESGYVHGSLRHIVPTKDEAYLRVVAHSERDLDRVYQELTQFFGFIAPKNVSSTNGLRVHRDYLDARSKSLEQVALGVPNTLR